MTSLSCNENLKNFLLSALSYPSYQKLTNYLNASSYAPSWDEILETIPELRREYRKSFILLHDELVPNYLSAQDAYSALWDLFKEVTLKPETYRTIDCLDQKLLVFSNEIKKTLMPYDVIYEISSLDIGDSTFRFGKTELFKLTLDYLLEKSFIKNASDIEKSVFHKIVNNSVLKTEVQIADYGRAYESGLDEVNNVLNSTKIASIWENLGTFKEQMFYWQISGHCIAIPKDYKDSRTGIASFNHHHSLILPIGQLIKKTLSNKQCWVHLLDSSLPVDILSTLNRAIKWINKAVTISGFDFKIVFLCTALEILLLPGPKESPKGALLALRYTLLVHGNGYTPETILYLYDLRSNIVHGGMLETTSYSNYWHLLCCCLEIIKHIISLSKQNPSIAGYKELIALVETEESLKRILDDFSTGIYDNKSIPKVETQAKERLKKIQTKRH